MLPILLSPFCYTESAIVILPLLLVKLLHSITFLLFFFLHKKLQYKCLFRMPVFPPASMTKAAHDLYY